MLEYSKHFFNIMNDTNYKIRAEKQYPNLYKYLRLDQLKISGIKYCKLHFITHRIIYFLPASVYTAENGSTLFCFRKRTVPLSIKKKKKEKKAKTENMYPFLSAISSLATPESPKRTHSGRN